MSPERGPSGDKNKLIEMSKVPDKVMLYGGLATYVLLGIPFALAVAAVGGAGWGATELAEKGYQKLKSKFKRKK